ncbi:MAG: ArsC/Spx/MgsR family protein, partial [Gammaproteobacteria bacterium]
RKAQKILEERGIAYTYRDITTQAPRANQLKKMAQQADLPLKKCLNTSGVQYRELNLKDTVPTLSDTALAELMASNGRLIKRPLVTDGTRSTVGFHEDNFIETWG